MPTQAEQIAANKANIENLMEYQKVQNGHVHNISKKVDQIVSSQYALAGMLIVGLLGILAVYLK